MRLTLSLLSLYVATFVLRFAAFLAVAVVTSPAYLPGSSGLALGAVVAVFAAAELATVLFFGALCDNIGRKPVLVFAHGLTAVATLAFAFTADLWAVLAVAMVFGVGAAAKVASTLTMVADAASAADRAQHMALFDLATLGGFAAGFVSGVVITNARLAEPSFLFQASAAAILVSLVLVLALVKETAAQRVRIPIFHRFRAVFGDPDIRRILPVYVPVIALYGLVIAFTERLSGDLTGSIEFSSRSPEVRVLAAVAGVLVLSMLLNARLSDRWQRRKPFLIGGLACFGGLAIALVLTVERLDILVAYWPVFVAAAVGAGAFPPAVLAYLGDIAKREEHGTTFGLYSVVFGSGLIIGPLVGGFLLDRYGNVGLAAAVAAFVAISCAAAATLPEALDRADSGAPAGRRDV